MGADAFETMAGDVAGHDFLFTWKPQHWPYGELRKLVETFRLTGTAEEPWSCAAHRRIHPGDRAYLLKQGKPMGIFGRATVVGKPKKDAGASASKRAWHALIRFDVSRGDVLWDPMDEFLVNESLLLSLPVPRKQWQNQSSGITLDANAARAIDRIMLDSILIGRGYATPIDEAAQEVARRNKLVEQWIRPDQQLFSETLRRNYRNKCAVTGCTTRAALEAAHISTLERRDRNSETNGILLRSDIHALFDSFLITLSEDGTKVETSPELTDPGYAALEGAVVARPVGGAPPSAENIREHRKQFFDRLAPRTQNKG